MAAHGRQVAALLLLLQLTSYANADHLDILPSSEVLIKPIGSSILLTCMPNVTKPNLISDMKWFDSQNREIEPFSAIRGISKPPMYTETHPGNGLALFFNSLQEEQDGQYTCKANYANTETLSKNITIQTIVGITWVDAPLNQYPILGEDFAVKCNVRARPSPTVDWFYNGDLITTDNHYIIETHALKIKNVQESDDGVYTCRASVVTTGELDTRAIRVEVHIRPEIQELESMVEIIEGENANIACKATGKPPPKFSWVKSLTQQNMATADRFGVDEDTGILMITNANRNDAGEYQCKAKNAAGEATNVIQIEVIVKPKIMEYLNVTEAVSKKAVMTCKAFGRPPPVVTFRKHTSDKEFVVGRQLDNDRIFLENTIDNASWVTTGQLTIDVLRRSDDGLYECKAHNKGGDAWKNGHITVEYPPNFESMTNHTVWSWNQRPVNLTCIANSIPNATIRWQFMTRDTVNDPRFRQIGNGPQSILIIDTQDSRYYNEYKCIASNIHGTREYTFSLKEGQKPGKLMKARISEITATTVSFELLPSPTHPDLPVKAITVQYKEINHIWSSAKNKTWAVGSPYILEGLTPEKSYVFRFSANNEVGDSNWGNGLDATTPRRSAPRKPEILNTTTVNDRQFHLRWIIPMDNGEPIDYYEIRYCPIALVGENWEVQDASCKREEVKSAIKSDFWLKNLQPDTRYRVEVKAHNAMGYSLPGSTDFKTLPDVIKVTEHEGPLISSAAIIGIVIAVLFILIIIIDVICCCANKTGIIFYVCERSRRKPVDEDDAKLGSLYSWRFPVPYCDQKMANVAGVTSMSDSGSGKNTIKLVKHTVIEEKEPLREEKKITPIIDSGLRRETSVNFNGKTSVSKTGLVGKDSAV
ncbi:fasciclin-2 isoform X2 [Neodiprion lecontei]|uniref:Fasciclin-2 isoform X2 n=1 Tax=Neodiprion lecontei TaxID=441921 RepID=A0ABM3GJC4_NEOLC|nr:fasciclin-2 isoform X2 [Neodiprion lecontei]